MQALQAFASLSQNTDKIYDIVSWSAMSAQVVIPFVMLRKRLHREFPAFFAYIMAQNIRSLITFPVYRYYGDGPAYFYVYWAGEFITYILMFAVMREVYRYVLQDYKGLQSLAALSFRWVFMITLGLAAISILVTPNVLSFKYVYWSLLEIKKAIRIMQCGLTGFILTFISVLNLTPRHFIFGVSLGFGLLSFVGIVLSYGETAFGEVGINFVYILLEPLAYLFATTIWLIYLIQKEPLQLPERIEHDPTMLERWNTTLLRVMKSST